jgi:hypothetical protein
LEPISSFDVLVGIEWRLGLDVDLLGWCERGELYSSPFTKTRFGHYNLEVPDSALLPMGRLNDHFIARLAQKC